MSVPAWLKALPNGTVTAATTRKKEPSTCRIENLRIGPRDGPCPIDIVRFVPLAYIKLARCSEQQEARLPQGVLHVIDRAVQRIADAGTTSSAGEARGAGTARRWAAARPHSPQAAAQSRPPQPEEAGVRA